MNPGRIYVPMFTQTTVAPQMTVKCPCGAEAKLVANSLAGVKALAETFNVAHAGCRGVID